MMQASQSTNLDDQDLTAVVATEVAEDNRLLFFPALFGVRLLMRGEAIVYGWMLRLSQDYKGGFSPSTMAAITSRLRRRIG